MKLTDHHGFVCLLRFAPLSGSGVPFGKAFANLLQSHFMMVSIASMMRSKRAF